MRLDVFAHRLIESSMAPGFIIGRGNVLLEDFRVFGLEYCFFWPLRYDKSRQKAVLKPRFLKPLLPGENRFDVNLYITRNYGFLP